MKLADYLEQNKLSEAKFAELIGVSQAAVNRYKRGRAPGAQHMREIITKTGGAVQPNDFFNDLSTPPVEPLADEGDAPKQDAAA